MFHQDIAVDSVLIFITLVVGGGWMSIAVLRLLTKIYFVALAGTPSYGAGFCGPNSESVKEALLPEYVCFSVEGGTLPYAVCAAGGVVGYKPVHFGTACRLHDDCYRDRGARKSQCDSRFISMIKDTCDATLTGRFRKLSRANCYNVASEGYHLVTVRGCKAYKNAQKSVGNTNPICN